MGNTTSERIYERLPIPLQNLAVSVYGLRLQMQRYGGLSRSFADELLEHEGWSAAQFEELQLELLRARAILAIERVPAYSKLASHLPKIRSARSAEEILQPFPILTKEEIRLAPESFIPNGVSEKINIANTGGTTGTPLRLFRTLTGIRKNFAFFRRIRHWRGLTHWNRTATFMGRMTVPEKQKHPPYWRRSYFTNNLQFSSYHMSADTLPAYARALADFRPEQIVCYPSGGTLVAKAVLDAKLSLDTVQAVFTTAETLSPEQRELMESAFGCPVADQYGSGEWTVTISQCEQGTYHLHPEYGYLEVLDDSGRPVKEGSGRAIATGFVNDAMVLMRFDTGDEITRTAVSCKCGRAFPTVAGIEGRAEDLVRTPDGRLIGRLNNFVFADVSGVFEGQLVQTAEDRLEVRVVTGEGWDDEATPEAIVKAAKARTGRDMRIDVVVVQEIERTASGKFRAVIGLSQEERGSSE